MTRRFKLFIIFVACCFATWGLSRLYFNLTDDFRLANITHELPFRSDWAVDSPTPELRSQMAEILNQPFYYLGKGAQSYAFASQDQHYVLKFIKFKHLRPSFFLEALPPLLPIKSYQASQRKRKQKNLEGVFAGYRLAYDVHRPESGLIFIHLNKTNDLNLQATLKDKLGIKRVIDLDNYVFILQEKGKTTKAVLKEILDRGDLALAKQRIDQIINLYLSEYRKGIYDKDHGVMHNTGFVGDRPIHLDVGKLCRNEAMKNPEIYRQDLSLVISKFTALVRNEYPQYYEDIADHIDVAISKK